MGNIARPMVMNMSVSNDEGHWCYSVDEGKVYITTVHGEPICTMDSPVSGDDGPRTKEHIKRERASQIVKSHNEKLR